MRGRLLAKTTIDRAVVREPYSVSALTIPVTPALVRLLTATASAILLGIVVVLPYRSHVIGFVPGFFTMYGIVLVAGNTLSGWLFIQAARRAKDGRAAVLAATFLFAAAMVFANIIALQSQSRPNGPNIQSWYWMMWHFGIPVGVLLSTVRTTEQATVSGALIAAGAACVLLVALPQALLTHLSFSQPSGRFTPLAVAMGTTAGALTIAAILRLAVKRQTDALSLILALALFAALGDIVLALLSVRGFSVGTYGARTIGLFSGLIVTAAVLHWIAQAIERADELAAYETIAEASPNIVLIADDRSQVSYVNHRWSEFTGLERGEAIGEGWRAVVHPDDLRERLRDPDAWYRSDGRDVRVRRRDGRYVWHLARYAPIRDAGGNRVGWIGNLINVDRERRALEESREVSAALRAAFLPRLWPGVDGLTFAAVSRPFGTEEHVGGDWYDAFALPDGEVAFTMGDVSGHGLAAAATMLRLRETLRMAALAENAPGSALALANRMLALAGDIVASALVVFIDPRTGQMRAAGAGHPRPLLLRRGEVARIETDGIILGASADGTFDERTSVLEPGDEIAFYSDGLIEAAKDPVRGEHQLEEALRERGAQPLDAIVDELLREGQHDDATIVVLAYRGSRAPPPQTLRYDSSRSDPRSAFSSSGPAA